MQNNLSIYHDLIAGIAEAMDARDPYTASHSMRVSDITELICGLLKLSKEEAETVHIAAHVHDIGKIGIDETLLGKRGKLTESEWADMKRHPEIGYHILRSVNEFAPIAQYVLLHHERVDGKGYPRQLKDEDIPVQSKIISIADAYDAMTSHRSYREDFSLSEVIEELKRNSGTQFDPEILKVFIDQILKQRIWRRMD